MFVVVVGSLPTIPLHLAISPTRPFEIMKYRKLALAKKKALVLILSNCLPSAIHIKENQIY